MDLNSREFLSSDGIQTACIFGYVLEPKSRQLRCPPKTWLYSWNSRVLCLSAMLMRYQSMLPLILTVEYSWPLVVLTLNFSSIFIHLSCIRYGSVGFLRIITKGVYGNIANLLSSFRHRGTRIASSYQTISSSLLSHGPATLHPILELPSPFCIKRFAGTMHQESKWIILNWCSFLQLVPFL